MNTAMENDTRPHKCCGGAAPKTAEACCRKDADEKARGKSGCGCGCSGASGADGPAPAD